MTAAYSKAGRDDWTVLFTAGAIGTLSDAELLARFARDRGSAPGRGGVRRSGRSPRADGAGRLPPGDGRPARGRRRLPGGIPGPRPQGPRGAAGARRFARPLALRGKPAGGPAGSGGGAGAAPHGDGPGRPRSDRPVVGSRPRASRPTSAPRSTPRSPACRSATDRRWSSATWRGSPRSKPPGGFVARSARCRAACTGRGSACGRAWPGGAWRRRSACWPECWSGHRGRRCRPTWRRQRPRRRPGSRRATPSPARCRRPSPRWRGFI